MMPAHKSIGKRLMAMGYFKEIHFIFLVVGHTKNAADHLFNSLKQEYWKQNLFIFDKLVQTFDKSPSLTIHPTIAKDFSTTASYWIACIGHYRGT